MQDTTIQMTFTKEEIIKLEKAADYKIENKEDLYQATRLVIDTYVSDKERGE